MEQKAKAVSRRARATIMFFACLGLLATASPESSGAQAEHSVVLPEALARVLADYEVAWRTKDSGTLATLFVEDGWVLPNGAPPVHGRPEIAKFYSGSGGALALHPLAFAIEGTVGYIIGGFSRQEGQADIGKFTLTLRKNAEGRWLIVSDMDNGNKAVSSTVRPSSPRSP